MLALGATYALRGRLTQALLRFAPRYPGVQVRVLFGTTDELAGLGGVAGRIYRKQAAVRFCELRISAER